VMSWGNGDYGQLGLGRPGSFDTPTEVEALSRAVRLFVLYIRTGNRTDEQTSH